MCPASPAVDWLEVSATLHPLDGKRVRAGDRSEIAGLWGTLPGDFGPPRRPLQGQHRSFRLDRGLQRRFKVCAEEEHPVDDVEVKEQFINTLDSAYPTFLDACNTSY
ncbi:hypothetical protein CYMTET_45399 [Cymbomonas tetramitiformis]|uniref:Uncharacterized protein n=1 Tax=Cymbomonas tetramitiformis TaxID=36881 RepID=A0AAE0BHV5_9CHLO|nr:hypothetical protein CYMTET_53006 [Cymbomonas tetramitiformis]KAK3245012.1 hypothetical protein CYMTET_45399 [Cymbomonas tetramitiformis]